MNISIREKYLMYIRTKHVSVFRTEHIDGIHSVFHAYIPGVQLVVFGCLLSMVASIVVLWRRPVGGVAPSIPEACQDIQRLCSLMLTFGV